MSEYKSVRLDVYLFSAGLARSRTHAQSMIEGGCVAVNGKPVYKPSYPVGGDEKIEIIPDDASRYVSRGGLKLEYALSSFGIDVTDATACDIGASTGGFTDSLLKHGAKKVYAVENGHGQLSASLLSDRRVISRENFNARSMSAADFPELFDIAVMDVSFVSQSLLYPAAVSVLKPGAPLVSLIKPQFEAGRGCLSKSGIIKDPSVYPKVIASLIQSAKENGLVYMSHVRSPITGGDGNTEFLAYFIKESSSDSVKEGDKA